MIANFDEKLEEIKKQMQQGFNRIQDNLNKMESLCKNQDAKYFVAEYYNNNFALPWTNFYSGLRLSCFEQKNLQDSLQLRKEIKALIDKNGDDFVDVSEVNQFFTNVWNNPQIINKLQNLSNLQISKSQLMKESQGAFEEDNEIENNYES